MELYKNNLQHNLSDFNVINSNIYISKIKDFTLKEYYSARRYICSHTHNQCTCDSMLQVAETVLTEGIVSMSEIFKKAFPDVTYHPRNAKRRLLQMPLVAVRVRTKLFLMEQGSLEKD